MRLAEQEMRLMIIKVLQNFRLEWPQNKQEPCQKYVMLLQPDGAEHIQFMPRNWYLDPNSYVITSAFLGQEDCIIISTFIL
jgi:Cytochrome P450